MENETSQVRGMDPGESDGANVPLVADLDDTLLATDSLYEGILNALRSRPLALVRLPQLLMRGRQMLKAAVVDTAEHVARYPINQEVLRLLQEAGASGREVWLATASPLPVAQGIAERLGIFNGILSSSDTLNLKGAEKARVLVERFGRKGFDYIGDALADMPVWTQARKAYVYGPPHLYARALSVNSEALHLNKPTQVLAALRELRIWQWVKNSLAFLPLFLSHDFSLRALALCLLVFFALSLCASAAYVINDMADLANDRLHPRKCHRPLASGALSLRNGLLLALGCLGGALCLGTYIGLAAATLLACYFFGTVAYSFIFKKLLILDALILAGLYDLRVVLGAVAIGAPLSNWLLSFLLLLFFGLALMKRSGDLELEGARLSGRAYIASDMFSLVVMQAASGFSAVTLLCLYVSSVRAQALYTRPDWLWLAAPTLLWWYCCLLIKAGRGEVKGDPLLFALKSPFTWIACGVIATSFILAL